MTPTPSEPNDRARARSLFWASATFYVLIAFEFFYMASPFAAYFYAVYGPGLDWLQRIGLSDWTLWFFLPHIVEQTRSVLINSAQTTGLVLFFGGLAVFFFGVVQIYRQKLRRSDAVTGGLYRYVRHPQYTALIIASIGMLLIWPRFLVLFSTVTVIFAYVALARAEERMCLHQYPGYGDYMARTGMFLPKAWGSRLSFNVPNRWMRIGLWLSLFFGIVALATVAAFGLRGLAISSLYTHDEKGVTYLSVAQISDKDLAVVAQIARKAPQVQAVLDARDETGPLLAYVLPTSMYVSEIPMHLPDGETFGHSLPRDHDGTSYKVIFTELEFGADGPPKTGSALASAINKHPLIEVHVNLDSKLVEASFPPPADAFYDNHQVPLF